MTFKRYFLVKQKLDNTIVYIDYTKLDGYKIKPKNNIKYDGVKVNTLILIKPSFKEKIIKRKIKRKLDIYLRYIIDLMDSDDEDAARIALNEITRYKSIIINNYRKHLDKKYIELLLKKIELIENEIKTKLITINYESKYYENHKKSR